MATGALMHTHVRLHDPGFQIFKKCLSYCKAIMVMTGKACCINIIKLLHCQWTFTCSKLAIETREQGVTYVQS